MRLELFAFCFRDPRTGKWVRARYVAERHEIAARPEFEIDGPPETREVDCALDHESDCAAGNPILGIRRMPVRHTGEVGLAWCQFA